MGLETPKQRRAGFAFWEAGVVALVLPLVVLVVFEYPFVPGPRWAGTLTEALEKYREAHGQHPESLSELAPGVITRVPEAGAWLPRPFEYRRSDGSPDWRHQHGGADPPYELWMRFSFLMGFSTLRYRPTQRYPDEIGGHHVIARPDGWVLD